MARALPRRCFRTSFIVLAAWLTVAVLPNAVSAKSAPAGASPVDLAALTLRPADLEAEGMTDFGVTWSWTFMTIREAMAPYVYAESRSGVSLADIPGAETVLQESGWQRFHETTLTRLKPGDPDLSAFSVSSGIEEYATADGAARAFAAFSDPAALDNALDGEVAMRPEAPPLGDQSVMWAVAGKARETDLDVPTTVLTRMARVGTRIISVNMVDFVEQTPIDPAVLDRLTSLVLERVARAGTAGQPCPPAGATGIRAAITDRTGLHLPGLSSCALRLDNTDAEPNRAYYQVFDGTAIRQVRETPEELAVRQADVDKLGIRDTYRVQFTIQRGDNVAFYSVFIDRYVDADAATAAFAGLEERLRADPDSPLVSFDAGMPAIGDASATFVRTDPATGNARTTSATRIADVVISVQVSQTAAPLQALTQALLQSQVACMEANDCTQPILVPPGIVPAQAIS